MRRGPRAVEDSFPARGARLAAIVAASAAAQLWLAYRDFGFLTGDDVEVLSEAFRRARGLHYSPWEIRNLFVPDVVVAPFVWLAHGASTRATIFIASLPFIALSALSIVLVYRLAGRWGGAPLVAALLFATHWIPLGFGSTVYPRNVAMVCVIGAALIVERWPFAAGALAAIAFADRFSEGVFVVPPHSMTIAAGFVAAAFLTVGVYDFLTYGTAFWSFLKFVHLTLIEPDFASRVKYQPAWWYLANIARWCSPALLPLLWFGRRSRAIWFIAVPLVAFSLVRHKELRYLQAVIPFLCVAASIGFDRMRNRRIATALVAIGIVWNLYGIRYFARKSQPAVLAAQWIASNESIHSIAASQLWAFGGKLYLGDRMEMIELGTPPEHLDVAGTDAVALYETDLDVPSREAALRANGYAPARTFRDGAARAVVVFVRSPSGTSDRARR